MSLNSSDGDSSAPENPLFRQQFTVMDSDTSASIAFAQRSAFHRLPVEILACILNFRFPEAGDIPRYQSDVAEIYRLRMVSKSWKELVEDTPTLWTHISTAYRTVVVQDCLRWSKNHLLRIRVFPAFVASAEALIERLQLLQPHSHRWKTLYYSQAGPDVEIIHIRNFLESPAPMLQSVHVNLGAFPLGVEVNLAGGKAEGLKHLTLQEGLLPWSSNLLHGLETLTISLRGTVPAGEILNIFATNPALRYFELLCEGAEGQDNPTTIATQSLDTVATSLKDVIIHVTHPHIITRILSQVSFPTCNAVEFSADFTTLDGNLHTLDEALVQFMTRIRETLCLGGRTTLLVSSDSEFEWSSPLKYEGFEFSFGFSGTDLGQLIEWIRHLSATLEAPLDLEISLTTPDRYALEDLGEWSEVTKLRIPWMADPDAVDEALSVQDFLGDVVVDPIGGLSWNLPNLRELDVYSAEYNLSSILGMLNKRYLPDAYVKEMEGVGVPIHIPSQIDLRVKGTTEAKDVMIMEALRRHWGVKSVDDGVDGR